MQKTKDKKVVIVGVGETGLLAYEYFKYDSEFEVVGFSVSKDCFTINTLNNLPVVCFEEIEKFFSPNNYYIFIAISSGKLNRHRTKMYKKAKEKGYQCASYISSHAFLWKNVSIGENCFVFENNTIQPFVKIGNNVTLWSGNHIGHNSIIHDNCFISSHCVISGYCEIEENCFLGVNCTIENNTRISRDNFIGANTLIRKNTEERSFFQEKPTQISKVNSFKLFRIKE